MNVRLNYGRQGLGLRLNDNWSVDVYAKAHMPVVDNNALAVAKALDNPVVGADSASPWQGKSACILICDITWPVPNGILLPALLDRLEQAGVEDITVLVAGGLNRPNLGAELEELVGNAGVFNRAKVDNHNARRLEDHVDLGRTSRGTPVLLDKRFVNADIKIVTGLVGPHFMAGYSGGSKVISPGICHQSTIIELRNSQVLEHPNAATCQLDNNPMHADQVEIANMLDRVWAVNVALDEQRRLSFVNFGVLESSYSAALKFVKQYVEVPVKKHYATVITSAAGYPLDQTYYQAIKGMVGAQGLLAPGGHLFIAAECRQGLGSPEFVQAQRRLMAQGAEKFHQNLLAKPQAEIDEWYTEMLLRALRCGPISLYAPVLNREQASLTGVTVVDDLESAIEQWVGGLSDKSVAVVPEGPYISPRGLVAQMDLPF